MSAAQKENGNVVTAPDAQGLGGAQPTRVDEVVEMILEDEMLTDAMDLYGMNIEPGGKELYFALKKIETEEPELYQDAMKKYHRIYGWDLAPKEPFQKRWKEFKEKYNLKKAIE